MTTIKLQKSAPGMAAAPQMKLAKPKSDKPNFNALFGDPPSAPLPNPLDSLAYPGDLEGDVLVEAQAIREAFQQKYRGELDRFRVLDDPEYWFLVCFQTREQKEAFLAAVGWEKFGGKRYLNGLDLARHLGVDIQPIALGRQEAKPVAKILEPEVTE